MSSEQPPPSTVDYFPTPSSKAAETSAPFTGMESPPGYQILRQLGRGGMGIVYGAYQQSLNRVVALKMIRHAEHAAKEEMQRFRDEAEAIARLHHPNVVQVFDAGEFNGLPFFAMEYCPGGSLSARQNGAPMQPAEAARLVEKLARALDGAHQLHIIHRDLKPANVLLGADGEPKVGDFGLAKMLDGPGQTHSGAILGTPSYMAPEQAGGKKGEVGPAVDIYALGAILYELLTGRPPFRAETTLETLQLVLETEPELPRILNPGVPKDLEAICVKCLNKEPSKRYSAAALLADDLQRYLQDTPVSARLPGVFERLGKNVVVASVAAFVTLVVGNLLLAPDYLLWLPTAGVFLALFMRTHVGRFVKGFVPLCVFGFIFLRFETVPLDLERVPLGLGSPFEIEKYGFIFLACLLTLMVGCFGPIRIGVLGISLVILIVVACVHVYFTGTMRPLAWAAVLGIVQGAICRVVASWLGGNLIMIVLGSIWGAIITICLGVSLALTAVPQLSMAGDSVGLLPAAPIVETGAFLGAVMGALTGKLKKAMGSQR